MIQKSIRVPTEKTGAIANYLASQGENEEITWLKGSEGDVRMMGVAARACGHGYSVRHIIIASAEPMTTEELAERLADTIREYKIPRESQQQMCVVEHKKQRQNVTTSDLKSSTSITTTGYEFHYHIVVPETDTETGRVLDSKHTKIRDEKLSRIAELRLGHPITLGRFNKEVYTTLAEERPELDLSLMQKAMEEANVAAGFNREDWLQYRAYSAYSSEEHQALNRSLEQATAATGIDYKEKTSLTKIKSQIRAMAEASNTALEFVSAVVEAGYDIQHGRKQGVNRLWLGDVDVGSLDRLAGRGMRRAEVADAVNEYYSSGGKKRENSGNKTAERTSGQAIPKRTLGVRSGPPGERGVCVGGQSGEVEVAYPDLEYSTSRGRRGQHRITHRKLVEGHRGSKTAAGAADAAKRSDNSGAPKPKLSASRIRSNFFRARDRIHAQRAHTNYVNFRDTSSSDGGGEVFDMEDYFMLARWAADHKRKSQISRP